MVEEEGGGAVERSGHGVVFQVVDGGGDDSYGGSRGRHRGMAAGRFGSELDACEAFLGDADQGGGWFEAGDDSASDSQAFVENVLEVNSA